MLDSSGGYDSGQIGKEGFQIHPGFMSLCEEAYAEVFATTLAEQERDSKPMPGSFDRAASISAGAFHLIVRARDEKKTVYEVLAPNMNLLQKLKWRSKLHIPLAY